MFKAAAAAAARERVLADGQVTWVREKVKTGVRMARCRLPGSVLAFSLTKGSLVFREGLLEAWRQGREREGLARCAWLTPHFISHCAELQGVKCKGEEAPSIFH